MEYFTIQKNIGNSPRKLRLMADMIREMDPQKALDVLSFTQNAAAMPLAKAIKTVLANAGNKPEVVFKSIEINEGAKMKRYRAGTAGRGRGRPYKRRQSQIKIVLTDEARVLEPKVKNKLKLVASKTEEKKVEVTEVKAEAKKEVKS